MDEPVEALELPKPRLEWNSKDQPVAFGTLLETPAGETGADDSVMTAQRDPNLGEPAFWAPKPQPEAEPGESDSDEAEAESSDGFGDEEQWHSGGALDEFPLQPEAVSEIAQPAQPEPNPGRPNSNCLPKRPRKPLQASTGPLPQLPELELPQAEDLEIVAASRHLPGARSTQGRSASAGPGRYVRDSCRI